MASMTEINVGKGLIKDCGDIISAVYSRCKIAIISDTNVAPLYLEDVKEALKSSGFDTVEYIFPAGESYKNIDTYNSILEFLASSEMTRTDMLLSLGGGVVGDITGFAAATYMRGIPYVHVPTSLIAMVDSSIGGKTAINLDAGKNLCGAFYQPLAVICDTETLGTLPDEYMKDGLGEVLKYDILGKISSLTDIDKIIEESISAKMFYANGDVEDWNNRRFLNLGHTIGHAIEHASGYTVSHGNAVAIGICTMARACEALEIAEPGTASKVESLATDLGLPTSTDISVDDLYSAILLDKKRSGETIDIIVPVSLGKCEIRTFLIKELQDLLRLGVN